MFGNAFFGNKSIRKHVALFGTLFNNIRIERTDNSDTTQHQKVPIAYGQRDKYIARNAQDPNIEREIAAQLPRMSFELMGIEPDAERRLNPVARIVSFDSGTATSKLMPAPFNFYFNLYITARFVEDAAKIVEQILPYFQPSFNLQASLVENDDCVTDVLVSLRNVDMKDNYEGPMTERRILVWTLTFSVKSWIFGPERIQKVIRWVDVDQKIGDSSNTSSTYTYQSNTYPTVDGKTLEEINSTDDYIVITDITEFFE
jgi:hypothetical protein